MRKTTQLISLFLLIALLSVLLPACRRAAPAAPIVSLPTVADPNPLEDIPCPFALESGGAQMTCGMLSVPEDYRDPQGAQVRLFVATVHSTGGKPAGEPVVVLYQDYGGPFAETARYATYEPLWAEVLKEHDLVFYDFRGVGLSEPETACPETAPALFGVLGQQLSRDARAKALAEVQLACRQKLVQSGLRLENYTTAQHVADLNSVVMALEGQKASLLAIGYGSYLSLRVMQDYPDRLRSALLSSPYNGQVLAQDAAARLHSALSQVFASCKANEKCVAAYPSLEQDFYAAVEKLDRTPAEITLTGTYLNSQQFPTLVNGHTFLDMAFAMISRSTVTNLPSLVYNVNLDRSYHLTQPMQDYIGYLGYGNIGMETTVYCQAYLETQGKPPRKGQPSQVLSDWQAAGQQEDELTCADWFSGKTEPSGNPGRPSSVPALVIYGEWNTYAPPDWVVENLKPFSKATLVEFPNTGWLFWSGGCMTQLATAFLDDPTAKLDTACAAATPKVDFLLPAK